jgi:ribose transport system substrate-binding protein
MKKNQKINNSTTKTLIAICVSFCIFLIAFSCFSFFMLSSSNNTEEPQSDLRNYHVLVIGEYKNRYFLEQMYKGANSLSDKYNAIVEFIVPESEAENILIQDLFDYATFVNADGIIAYINNPEQQIEQPYRIDNSIIPVVTTGQFAPNVKQVSFIGNSSWELGKIFAEETRKMINFSGNVYLINQNSGNNQIVNSNIINSFKSEIKHFKPISFQLLENCEDIHKIKNIEKLNHKTAFVCLSQEDTLNTAQLISEFYPENNFNIIGFGNNETCKMYLIKGKISKLIYSDPIMIGETAMKELFEYRTKGYSNSYVTVGTQIMTSINAKK